MPTPTYLKAFRAFLVSQPTYAALPEMEYEFYASSDRPAVILQAANVEDILRSTIERKMRQPLSNDLRDRLFEGGGPLSSFSHKILVGYALGLFGPKFRHDLDLIRELRNGFAHVRHPMTLTTPAIAAVCKHLSLPDDTNFRRGPKAYYDRFPDLDIVNDNSHPRTRFTIACHTVAVHLLELQQAILTNVIPYALP